MDKLIFALIAAIAVIGGLVTFTIPYDEPAKAEIAVGVDPFDLMSHAVNLPDVHYIDYSFAIEEASEARSGR
jgi:hypothetical protein